MGVARWWKLIRHRSNEKSNNNKNDTGSWVCGNYKLIFREWKRSIDRLGDKNAARWIYG